MFDRDAFERDKRRQAAAQGQDRKLNALAHDFNVASYKYDWGYQWTWLGMPIIQLPPDILAVQEILWQTRPTLIIETGIAWGGSIVFYASILQLLGEGRVIGIDSVLPENNRREIMKYPFSHRITLLEGSSIADDTVAKVRAMVQPDDRVMVLLDSNHTHDHVLAELQRYAPLVTKDQYLVVSDTCVEYFPDQMPRKRPWGPGSNPLTALRTYMMENNRFAVDEYIDSKLLLTYTPQGYLRCVK
jgi:cephalosporin hydroxylase